ncbi:MAG TPA: ABC transporter ATP-binding protein [Anaerolineae bacterium]|nr:ABC transporter ATP-binding protein [Caldilineae bacterium]HID35180.1 ABC transporter ATP-binding protein [Anaerolineae bacterium]HIQ12118.1 ABC transporter ATP-binding protein [Caldilineales bacterium]
MSKNVIETRNLTKRYNGVVAVDGLNLTIHEGEIFGMLGPNGSGKTTTILMLLGLTEPTSGQVRVLGLDPARQPLSVKAQVGYIPDQVGFYDDLTAVENLMYTAKLNGIPRKEALTRIDQTLERLGLAEVKDRAVKTYSRGMRQRLAVADVLIKQPRMIIMDEPTQGLDPEGAHEFLKIIRDLKENGITVLLASHLLHQVQSVCDRVGLFNQGRMATSGTVEELAQKYMAGGYRIELEATGDRAAIEKALKGVQGVTEVAYLGRNRYEVRAKGDLRAETARAVVLADGGLLSLHVEAPSLDDIYVRFFQEVKHDSQRQAP